MTSSRESDARKARRIFVATHAPISTGGGVERFLTTLATTLTEDGFDVRMVFSDIKNPVYSMIRPFAAWATGRKVRRVTERGDLTICNNYFSWNIPTDNSIVIYHGTEAGRALCTRKVYSRLRNLLVGTVNSYLDRRAGMNRYVIAVSNSVKREIERYYGLKVDRVVPNAVDTSAFTPSEDKSDHRRRLGLPIDKFLVCCIGSHDARKGSRLLRKTIIPSLSDEQHFVMIGRESRRGRGITPLGEVPFGMMKIIYNACDAFLMPSYYEGCGLSTLEALSCGVPAVVSPTGVGCDLKSNKILGEYVISCEEPQRYVDALRKLQNSQAEWMRVSLESRRYAVEFHDLSIFRREYLSVINSISDQSSPSVGDKVLD
ncbi:MAG: glycosyltransferase family 4 protein [Methanobacteriota archaeon]|nr:MAG: glycosyltransferase family 4 protein [Euryarchaeota archaeon]